MTIFQLECYYALAQSLNFTQTANQQYITQPALSRSISSLEQELGIKLVNRTTHSVSLTPAGRVFANECRKIITTYQQGVQDALLASQNFIGNIRFGVPIDSFEPLAVKLVQAVSEKHSGVHIELKFNPPTRLLRSLDDGSVDLIIASGMPRSTDSESYLIDQRKDYVVVSDKSPLAGRERISFQELKNENFIAISRSSSIAGYQSIIDHASDGGFSPNIVGEAETVSSLLMQVACGVGISVLYKEHQPSSCDSVKFIPLTGGRMFNRYLIWNQLDNSCLNAVLEVAKELFPPADK